MNRCEFLHTIVLPCILVVVQTTVQYVDKGVYVDESLSF